MAQGKTAKEQIGVELPEPTEPQSVELPAPDEPERPDFLLDKFKSIEDQARGYAEAERRIQESAEAQKRLEAQIGQLTELVQGMQEPESQPQQQGVDPAFMARLNESFEANPIETIAYLAQQYAQAEVNNRLQSMQAENDPALRAQQNRDNQLLAMFVDQRLSETLDDWGEYRDRVGEAIVQDESLIPEAVLNDPEATMNAIRRVYQVVKAQDILEAQQNGSFVSTEMKRQAQTMTGSGVRGPEANPTDEKMDALQQAVKGMSYSAFRG
jgi:flagellar biosynthesis/type III secretory pathway chaperone